MTRSRRGWLAGFVVGVTAGFLTLTFPTLGWLLILALAIPAAVVGPRAAAIGGLLAGVGGVWAVLLGRVALTCRATGDELGCHPDGIERWIAIGGAMLALGIALTTVAVRRSGRQGPDSRQSAVGVPRWNRSRQPSSRRTQIEDRFVASVR